MNLKNQTEFTKINIGCGYDKKDDYINVDVHPDCNPDLLIVDGDDSCILRNHYELVYAKDVLEHISRSKTLETLLDWSDYLKLGGIAHIETSDIEGVIDLMRENTSFANQYGMTICMFGNQRHPGDFHYTGFTHNTLKVFLLAAGFEILEIYTKDKWLLNIKARKIIDWSAYDNDETVIDYVFQKALNRPPEPHHYIYFHDKPAKEILKSVWSSQERLFSTATAHNL